MASMPAEQAPERMISAFSMMVTRTLGSTRAASVATKQPALPPPMMSRSVSTTTVSISSRFSGVNWRMCAAGMLAMMFSCKKLLEPGTYRPGRSAES